MKKILTNRPAVKQVLVLATAITGLTVLAILLLVWRFSRERGCVVSQDSLLHPLKICSAFNSRTQSWPTELASQFKLPLFPGAKESKAFVKAWQPYSSTDSKTANGLFVLELTSNSQLPDVTHWYANAFGADFQKTETTCAALGLRRQEWLNGVLEECMGTSVVFLRNDEKQASGVLILSPGHEGCVIRLFFNSRAKPLRSRG